ncbi:hypothetical protein ABIF61_008098 [Bradyrhizobium japonicum]
MLMQTIARTPAQLHHPLAKWEEGARPKWLGLRNQPQEDENRQAAPKYPFELLHAVVASQRYGASLT